MVLGDTEIRRLMRMGLSDSCDKVGPASIDIRLGSTFLVPKRKLLGYSLGEVIQYKRYEIRNPEKDYFTLRPGQFVLGTTVECVDLPTTVAAFVQGRSSIGRAGLTIQNAGFVDPGFFGHITLELKNETKSPLILRAGYPVGQLVFMQCTDVEYPYDGKYNGQVEATGSRMQYDNMGVCGNNGRYTCI